MRMISFMHWNKNLNSRLAKAVADQVMAVAESAPIVDQKQQAAAIEQNATALVRLASCLESVDAAVFLQEAYGV